MSSYSLPLFSDQKNQFVQPSTIVCDFLNLDFLSFCTKYQKDIYLHNTMRNHIYTNSYDESKKITDNYHIPDLLICSANLIINKPQNHYESRYDGLLRNSINKEMHDLILADYNLLRKKVQTAIIMQSVFDLNKITTKESNTVKANGPFLVTFLKQYQFVHSFRDSSPDVINPTFIHDTLFKFVMKAIFDCYRSSTKFIFKTMFPGYVGKYYFQVMDGYVQPQFLVLAFHTFKEVQSLLIGIHYFDGFSRPQGNLPRLETGKMFITHGGLIIFKCNKTNEWLITTADLESYPNMPKFYASIDSFIEF